MKEKGHLGNWWWNRGFCLEELRGIEDLQQAAREIDEGDSRGLKDKEVNRIKFCGAKKIT